MIALMRVACSGRLFGVTCRYVGGKSKAVANHLTGFKNLLGDLRCLSIWTRNALAMAPHGARMSDSRFSFKINEVYLGRKIESVCN